MIIKTILSPGNGADRPKDGDQVTMNFTGWVRDDKNAAGDYKGKKFDSTIGSSPFVTEIGTGKVIRGWDEGIVSTDGGMTLGEKARLEISRDFAYGIGGFPGLIPPFSDLIFEVELLGINGKMAR